MINIFLTQFWTENFLIHKPQPLHGLGRRCNSEVFAGLIILTLWTCIALKSMGSLGVKVWLRFIYNDESWIRFGRTLCLQPLLGGSMREAAFVLGCLLLMILGVVSNECNLRWSRLVESLGVAVVQGGCLGWSRPRHAPEVIEVSGEPWSCSSPGRVSRSS